MSNMILKNIYTPEEFVKIGRKLIKKYSKSFSVNCPNCGKLVDTIIISNGKFICPFCQRMNILDAFSVLAKMPEGHDKVHAVFGITNDEEHNENNMIVESPKYDKNGKLKEFGYIKMYVSDKLLKDAKEFIENYIIMICAVDKKLFNSVFGIKIEMGSRDNKKIFQEREFKK